MAYQPIENYGIIGNMRTVALIGVNGSIDWYCCPHFDSPSVFGAILDDRKGGRFQVCPIGDEVRPKQIYWPDTNVLVSRFLSPQGIAEIQDFMPAGLPMGDPEFHQIIRRIKVIRGTFKFKLLCEPAFNYGRTPHETELCENGVSFRTPELNLSLSTGFVLERTETGVVGECVLEEGQTETIVLRKTTYASTCNLKPTEQEAEGFFQGTVRFWRHWLSDCTYQGRWREQVYRSALALKLLTFEPTGAIVAAPTCSLPEFPGGQRNWDYRYTWVRDAAFTIYGLLRIGLTREATSFMDWLDARCGQMGSTGPLQTVYTIDGSRELPEFQLDHFEGYMGSRPVRVGNAAYQQLQLDIYGELLDSVYLFNKYGAPISYDSWTRLRGLLDWLSDHWMEPDQGIWEIRGDRQHFTHSKMMCWVALDRGLRLAQKRSFPLNRLKWLENRDRIYEEIMTRGWDPERGIFKQAYGNSSLDASNLLMPLMFFVAPSDPRMLRMLDAIQRKPSEGGLVSDGLVHRYDTETLNDGVGGNEGTFNMCSFWLVEALTRAGRVDPGKLDQARLLFERMLGYASHLGLYAEQTGPSGQALGNFPQAFTHLALISAAFNLDRALSAGKRASLR